MTVVAIIPARGGSKRIPGKNIKPFAGKPIIAYSVETAINSGLFDRIIVSTDCERIKAVAEQYGAEVPFMRDPALADDYTGVMDVVRDTLNRLDAKPDFVCLIYATAPMLTVSNLSEGFIRIKYITDAPYVLSVTDFNFPIQRALVLDEDGYKITAYALQDINSRSQDLPKTVHDAAQFLWCRGDAVINRRSLYSGETVAVRIPNYLACDIDTQEDWIRAELMYQAWKDSTNG